MTLGGCFGNRESYRKPDRLAVTSGKMHLWSQTRQLRDHCLDFGICAFVQMLFLLSFYLILRKGGQQYVFQNQTVITKYQLQTLFRTPCSRTVSYHLYNGESVLFRATFERMVFLDCRATVMGEFILWNLVGNVFNNICIYFVKLKQVFYPSFRCLCLNIWKTNLL